MMAERCTIVSDDDVMNTDGSRACTTARAAAVRNRYDRYNEKTQCRPYDMQTLSGCAK